MSSALLVECDSGLVTELICRHRNILPGTRPDLLAAAASEKLRVVLASAWQAEGVAIGEPLERELAFWRDQVITYSRVVADLHGRLPGTLTQIKGSEIADRYPDGWIRDSADVDLVVATREALWAATSYLTSVGWRCNGLSVLAARQTLHVAVSMARPSSDALLLELQTIELSTIAFTGNFVGVATQPTLPPDPRERGLARQLLGLVEERSERTYTARDSLDAMILLDDLSIPESEWLSGVLDAFELWPEWHALICRIADLVEVPSTLTGSSTRRRLASRVHRCTRAVRTLAKPSVTGWRVVDELTMRRPYRASSHKVARWIFRRVDAFSVLDSGCPVYGRFISADTSQHLTIARASGRLQMACPLGTFLLSYGGLADGDAARH